MSTEREAYEPAALVAALRLADAQMERDGHDATHWVRVQVGAALRAARREQARSLRDRATEKVEGR